jgi:SNF2 family DNA or RNA helicase
MKKAHTGIARTLRPLIARAEVSFLLTGTPIHNKPEDLHQLIDLCALGKLGSKWTFARRFFAIEQGKFGCRIGRLLDKEGLRVAVAPYILARTVAEAYGELPARIRKLMRVETAKPLARLSREQLRVRLDDAAAGVNGLLRDAAKLKLQAAAELCASLNEPCVLYTYERADASELVKRLAKLQVRSVLATGELVTAKRAAAIENWKSGGPPALVCTMDAVRESATLTRAAAMIFVDLDWLPGKQLQCEGRIDPARQREGERRPARYYYVVTAGGPDEVVAERVFEKIVEMQGVVSLDESLDGYAATLRSVSTAKVAEPPAVVLNDLIARLLVHAERADIVCGRCNHEQ